MITLLIDPDAFDGAEWIVEGEPYRHLFRARRMEVGAQVRVVDGRGRARHSVVVRIDRSTATLAMGEEAPANEPTLLLDLFAPTLRPERAAWMVEKATELGVSALLPVMTRHTDVSRINFDRMRSIAIEAAEQCERLSVPVIQPAQNFDAFLAGWPAARRLYYLDETGGGLPIAPALRNEAPDACGFLVGPEGGFAQVEHEALEQHAFAVGVGLGPRILRAETAAFAALACWQALRGDWS